MVEIEQLGSVGGGGGAATPRVPGDPSRASGRPALRRGRAMRPMRTIPRPGRRRPAAKPLAHGRPAGRLPHPPHHRRGRHGDGLRGGARVAPEPRGAQGHAPRFRSSASYLRRFHTEARSAAGLHHTNIVSVFDFGEHDGVCYYAMQYIAGHGLDAGPDDVRRLRRPRGNAAHGRPDRTRSRSHPRAAAVHDAAQTEAAADSLRQTVTLGLLTGRFAGHRRGSRPRRNASPATEPIAPVVGWDRR